MVNYVNEHLMRNVQILTQLPFEIKMRMPPTDKGKRGYSDEFVAKLKKYH